MAIAEKELEQHEQDAAGATPAAAPTPLKGKQGPEKKHKQQPQPAGPAPVTPSPSTPAAVRRKFSIPAYVPWLAAAVVLTVGGFWLVLNPGVITNNLNQPYALLAGPALVCSFLAGWLIIKFFTAIERVIRSAWGAFLAARKNDDSAQFFWMVIWVFLVVSVLASGEFFAKLEGNTLPGLGYATALFIDLVAVQCMRARLNAGRMRDKRGQWLYLLGVLICAAASAFANVYTSLSTFNDTATGALPAWMPAIAPWFGLVFPALIVLLSMTADYTIDQTSSKLDPEQYKQQEAKRVKMLEYQRDLLRDRVEIEQDIDELAARLRGQKERRVFFLWAWLFPAQAPGKKVLAQIEKLYKPQLEALTAQNAALRGQLATLETNAQAAYNQLAQAIGGFTRAIDEQRDTDNRLIVERLDGLASASAATSQLDYKALAEQVLPLLRQEVRLIAAAAPAPKMKINYSELARAVAPLVVAKQENTDGFAEANTEAVEAINGAVNGAATADTEELQLADIEALTTANGHGQKEEETATDESTGKSSNSEANTLMQQSTVSLQEAAELLGCDVKYIRTLRDRRKIKATPRNRERFTVESIKAYLAEKRRPVQA